VAAYLGWGGARDEVIVTTEAAIPIPSGVADEVAAGVPITYGTAIHGLKDRANVQPNEWVAVTGAAGGAGLAAIEIAKVMGARVIAVASSEEKLAICRAHGADAVIDYGKEDLKQALRERTGGAGVDVVYDCVGGEAAEPALRALRWNGRFLVVGFASGDIPKFPLNLLLVRGGEARSGRAPGEHGVRAAGGGGRAAYASRARDVSAGAHRGGDRSARAAGSDGQGDGACFGRLSVLDWDGR
jgi:NADPH2:quinone reductase